MTQARSRKRRTRESRTTEQRLIAAALIRDGDRVLLVNQKGPDDSEAYWAIPSGAAKAGELIPEALAPEVQEETGLIVRQASRLLYVAQVDRPAVRDQFTAFVFEVLDWSGEIAPSDPDGFIREARFFSTKEAAERLAALPYRPMCEPIHAYLRGAGEAHSAWFYRQVGLRHDLIYPLQVPSNQAMDLGHSEQRSSAARRRKQTPAS